jgi:hypothetical protein
MKKRTIRKLEEFKIDLEHRTWVQIFEDIYTLPEIYELVEERFSKENEELKYFKKNTEDFIICRREEKKLDIKKCEWIREYIKNFDN